MVAMLLPLFARLDRLAQRFETAATARPAITLLAMGLLALAAAAGLTQMRFANDYRVFFSPQDPARVAQEQLESTFVAGDTVNIVVHRQKRDLFNPADLAMIADAAAQLALLPHVRRVDSLASYQTSKAEADALIVAPLLPVVALSQAQASAIEHAALADPAVVNRLIAADGKTAQLIATVALPENDAAALDAIANATAALKTRLQRTYPTVHVSTTGVVLLSHSFYDITKTDMMKLIPIMSVILLVAIAAFFRSWSAAFAALLTLGLSVLATMGIGGWLGFTLSPASGQVPVIILTIATAEAIHLIGVMKGQQRQGLAMRDAARASVRANHLPIFLTTLTDVLGFLCFNFSDTPPFRDLGNLASIGALVAYGFSVLFLPALLCVLPVKANTDYAEKDTQFARVAAWCMEHRGKVLVAFTVVTIGLAAQMPKLAIKDNFIEWLAPQQAFRVDAEFINERLPGLYAMQFALPAAGLDGVSDPAYLQQVDQFSDWLKLQPQVHHVWSITELMKRLNRNMHNDLPNMYILPESRALAAQYLLLYEMSLEPGADLTNQISLDKSSSRMVVALKNVSSAEMMLLKQRAEDWLKQNTPTLQTPATGTALMFASLTQNNTKSMIGGTLASFVMIALTLTVALRSARLGLASLLPSIAPSLMAFGLWYFLVGHIGLYAAFVVSCALGLVVDATTHFMLDYHRAARKLGHYGNEAVLAAFRHIGMDLWVSSIVLALGFGILTFSDFAIIAKLSQMVTLIFLFGIATTFLMLPALLSLMDQPHHIPRLSKPASLHDRLDSAMVRQDRV
jgi:uncharacterized protein